MSREPDRRQREFEAWLANPSTYSWKSEKWCKQAARRAIRRLRALLRARACEAARCVDDNVITADPTAIAVHDTVRWGRARLAAQGERP